MGSRKPPNAPSWCCAPQRRRAGRAQGRGYSAAARRSVASAFRRLSSVGRRPSMRQNAGTPDLQTLKTPKRQSCHFDQGEIPGCRQLQISPCGRNDRQGTGRNDRQGTGRNDGRDFAQTPGVALSELQTRLVQDDTPDHDLNDRRGPARNDRRGCGRNGRLRLRVSALRRILGSRTPQAKRTEGAAAGRQPPLKAGWRPSRPRPKSPASPGDTGAPPAATAPGPGRSPRPCTRPIPAPRSLRRGPA